MVVGIVARHAEHADLALVVSFRGDQRQLLGQDEPVGRLAGADGEVAVLHGGGGLVGVQVVHQVLVLGPGAGGHGDVGVLGLALGVLLGEGRILGVDVVVVAQEQHLGGPGIAGGELNGGLARFLQLGAVVHELGPGVGHFQAQLLIVGLVVDDRARLGGGLGQAVHRAVDGDGAQEGVVDPGDQIPILDVQEAAGGIQVVQLGAGIVDHQVGQVVGGDAGLEQVVALGSAGIDLGLDMQAQGFLSRFDDRQGAGVQLGLAAPEGDGHALIGLGLRNCGNAHQHGDRQRDGQGQRHKLPVHGSSLIFAIGVF